MLELPPEAWSAYRARLRDEHNAGWLPAKHYLVLVTIADLNIAGDHEPTVAKIAVNAGCDPSTVRRARARAQGRGLLRVHPQFDLVEIDKKPRRRQIANHYELVLPTAPVIPKPKKPRTSEGRQTARPIRLSLLSKKLPKEIDLLAARVQAFQAQQLAHSRTRWLN